MSEIDIGWSDIDPNVLQTFIGKKDTLIRYYVNVEGIWIVYSKYRTSSLLENKLLIFEERYIEEELKYKRNKIINDLLNEEGE